MLPLRGNPRSTLKERFLLASAVDNSALGRAVWPLSQWCGPWHGVMRPSQVYVALGGAALGSAALGTVVHLSAAV